MALTLDIANGKHDDELDAIAKALRARAKQLARELGAERLSALKVGDRVEIEAVRPKYLAGTTGTIVTGPTSEGFFEVAVDEPRGRYRRTVLVCRPQSLKLLRP